MALAILACAGGGKSNSQNEVSDGIKWSEKDVCAVIFLGYGQNFSALAESNQFKAFCTQYPSLQKMTKCTVETEGDEFYYIIPRYSNATVTLHEYRFDIENMEELVGKALYKGGAEPLLVRCNLSDIHPNTSVSITGGGQSVTFNPTSSLWGLEGVQCINTAEGYMEALPLAGFSMEYEYTGVYAGIHARVVNGKVSIQFDREEAIYVVGDEDFVPESNYVVTLAAGRCKGIFIGDVGQDFNPILCCQLEDGGIEILPLYDALRRSDFSTSGRLYGHQNVVSVSNEGVQFEGGEGGYVGLFSTDVKGMKKEIELCIWLDGSWEYFTETEQGEMCFLLELTSGWKISFKSGPPNSEAQEFFVGKFWVVEDKNIDDGFNLLCGYEMKEADRSEMTGEAPDPKLRTGTFRMQAPEYWADYLDVTCVKGLRFSPAAQGETTQFGRSRSKG